MQKVPTQSIEFGSYFSNQFHTDVRHFLFTLSRYKFAAKMLGDFPRKTVLELGCNEGIGTAMLAQVAKEVLAVDFDRRAIECACHNLEFLNNADFLCEDFLAKSYGKFNAVVALDVIEHISKNRENYFIRTLVENLAEDGFVIVGTPNQTASIYASEASQIGHINLFGYERLKELFNNSFKNVFLFGMNDEVLHTGFLPMCHYLFVLACNKRC